MFSRWHDSFDGFKLTTQRREIVLPAREPLALAATAQTRGSRIRRGGWKRVGCRQVEPGENCGEPLCLLTLINSVPAIAPWPKDWKPFITLNQPGQVDEEIERIAMDLIRVGAPRAIDDPQEMMEALRPLGTRVSRFAEAIYATRYHQLQFLFRLRKVVGQQTFAFSPPRGKAVVRINDRPLQAELEAFLIRVTSALDATAKVLCTLGKWSDKHGSFHLLLTYLKNVSTGRDSAEARLFKVLRRHEDWVTEVKQLRHAIAHEGTSEQFVPVSHEGLLLHDAKVAGWRAGEFVVRIWKRLKALTKEVVTAFPARS